jgi:hypothetical protein
MKTPYLQISLLATFLLSGCVSSSNLFHDGHTSGKDNLSGTISLNANYAPSFEVADDNNSIDLEPHRVLAPWAEFQLSVGITDRTDLGGSIGVGLMSAGMQLFVKNALLSTESPLGISVLAIGGVSGSTDTIEDTDLTELKAVFAVPMSYAPNRKNAFLIQPILSLEGYSANFETDDGRTLSKRIGTHQYKLGIGYLIRNPERERDIYFNCTLSKSDFNNKIIPSFGFALGSKM